MQGNSFLKDSQRAQLGRNDVGFGPSRFSGCSSEALAEVEREQHAQLNDA